MRALAINFRHQRMAVMVLSDDGSLRYEGEPDNSARGVVDYYAEFAQGEHLFELLLRRLRGHWNAVELDMGGARKHAEGGGEGAGGGNAGGMDATSVLTQPVQGMKRRKGGGR